MADEIPLRADAQRNRERILAAAEEVFLKKGATASLDDVAKRAGVGIGTLYRRFPTREELLAAAYSSRFLALAETSRARDTGHDPLNAMRAYLEELVQHTNVYSGLAASLGTVLQVGTPGCAAASKEGMRLLENAQTAGVIRHDIDFSDIVCIATAISLATGQESLPKAQIVRLVGVFMDGMAVR
ncbi:AcrR family transcriptional regulator [Rhizobium sp. BK650]|uniref:TetR/AcrR family transcriptional regulator n=1 Tax=Rhizobium sp. BK650 TaxID=2586990 RepID=UPI00161F56C8|nr:TetR/AcrR family transcriptional regulator [Rhizobium sp. BK650]MBB3656606.1 AcrR family transcriptional regulator [Rhizobium sp. BK650]